MQVLHKIMQENKEKQLQDAKMRAYIGTQIAEDKQKQDKNWDLSSQKTQMLVELLM